MFTLKGMMKLIIIIDVWFIIIYISFFFIIRDLERLIRHIITPYNTS